MRELDGDVISGLVNDIYQCAMTGEWQPLVEKMSAVAGDIPLTMYGYDMVVSETIIGGITNYDPDFNDTFMAHFGAISPWTPRIMQAKTGTLLTSDQLLPRDQLQKTEFYNDWVVPQGDIVAGGGMTLFNEADRMVLLAGNIRERDRDKLEHNWLCLLKVLSPHLSRAFQMQRALEGAKLQRQGYSEALDRIGNAVVLLDKDGCICHFNKTADAILQKQSLLYLDQFHVLHAFDPEADRIMSKNMHALSSGETFAGPEVFAIKSRDMFDPYFALLLPFGSAQELIGEIGMFLQTKRPVAVLTLVDPARKRNPVIHILTGLYKMTPAEAELAQAMSQGDSLSDYAASRELSIHTVRNQLKMVFQKAGVNKQSELITLIALIPG